MTVSLDCSWDRSRLGIECIRTYIGVPHLVSQLPRLTRDALIGEKICISLRFLVLDCREAGSLDEKLNVIKYQAQVG